MNTENNFKKFLISKMAKLNTDLNSNYKDIFENPDNYLSISPNVVIGKRITGPKYTENHTVVPYSIVGTPSEFMSVGYFKKKTTKIGFNEITKLSFSPSLVEDDKKKQNKILVERINENQLDDLYEKTQQRIRNNRNKMNDFLKTLPNPTRSKLKLQEEALNLNEKFKKNYNNKLERVLTKQSKKGENQLLTYTSDFFRQKKELKEMFEDTRPLNEIYGRNTWHMSLRRPIHFHGTRYGTVNIGTESKPTWKNVKETYPKDTLKIRVTKKNLEGGVDYFRRSDYFNSKVKVNFERECQSLEVVGDDLLKSEIENNKNLHGRKIIYWNNLENQKEEEIGVRYEKNQKFFKKKSKK